MGTLGSGVNTAWIYDKNGTRRVAPLKGVNDLRWTRSLNSISEAAVSVSTGQHSDCCDVLGSLGTWGHSLVFQRDGERVWEGPITSLRYKRGGVAIGAHDVLGWAIKNVTDSARLTTAPGFRAVDELFDDIGRVFAAHDPNVLAHVVRLGGGSGPFVTRDVKAYGGYFDDQFNELVKGGAMYTTIGRRIIVWPNTTIMGRLPTLFPTRHMSGDVEVEEDGLGLSVRSVGVNDKGLSGVAPGSVDVHPFYGQIEDIVPYEGTDATMLGTVAEQFREAHFPAPVYLNVPAGSVLSCDAPYAINDLVCGSLMNVKIDEGMCRKVEATQQLSAVEVKQDRGGEKVAITVAPLSGVLT